VAMETRRRGGGRHDQQGAAKIGRAAETSQRAKQIRGMGGRSRRAERVGTRVVEPSHVLVLVKAGGLFHLGDPITHHLRACASPTHAASAAPQVPDLPMPVLKHLGPMAADVATKVGKSL
jgi:hypothetical protein